MNSKRRNFRVSFGIATILLAAIVFFVISVLGSLHGARVDMTSDKLFTMSPAAANILQSLQVPVQVKLYITPEDKMPTQLRTLERDITEQIRDFERVSQGMLQFSVHNPQDDEQMQTSLQERGISPFQVQSVEKDEYGVKLIWSAMTIAYKDKPAEVVPRLLPQALGTLEQDIIGPIFRLTRDKAPKVAVYGPKYQVDQQLAMMYLQQGMQPPQPQDQYASIVQVLDHGHYESVYIDITAESPIPADADLLIVMAVTALNERQIYEINRAMTGGMPVILAVQEHDYRFSPARNGGWDISGTQIGHGLDYLLSQFGLSVSKDHFMDASSQVLNMPRPIMVGGRRMQTSEPVRAPVHIRVTEGQMLQDSALVNRLSEILFQYGTPIQNNPQQLSAAGLELTNLIESSPNCWQEVWNDGPMTPNIFNPNGKKMLGSLPLAVLVEGTFPDTYAGRPTPEWPAAAPAPGEEPTAAVADVPAPVVPQPGKLFVVGSARMFDDRFISAPLNALLLLNAVDYLAGSKDLLAIRSKIMTGRVIRPAEATEKMMWQIFVVALIPVLIAAFGVARAGIRRKEATRYRQEIKRMAGNSH